MGANTACFFRRRGRLTPPLAGLESLGIAQNEIFAFATRWQIQNDVCHPLAKPKVRVSWLTEAATVTYADGEPFDS